MGSMSTIEDNTTFKLGGFLLTNSHPPSVFKGIGPRLLTHLIDGMKVVVKTDARFEGGSINR